MYQLCSQRSSTKRFSLSQLFNSLQSNSANSVRFFTLYILCAWYHSLVWCQDFSSSTTLCNTNYSLIFPVALAFLAFYFFSAFRRAFFWSWWWRCGRICAGELPLGLLIAELKGMGRHANFYLLEQWLTARRNRNGRNCTARYGRLPMNCAVRWMDGTSSTMCWVPCSTGTFRNTCATM